MQPDGAAAPKPESHISAVDIGCLSSVAIFIAACIFLIAAANFGITSQIRGLGEYVVNTITDAVATLTTGSGGDTRLGEEVPAPMRNLFIEAAQKTGTPAAMIAAISAQECRRLWTRASIDPTTVQRWIDSNQPPDNSGCNFNNGYNVYGPMQFQVGIDYLRAKGYSDIRITHPDSGRPLPRRGTWEGYVSTVAALTNRLPSEIEPYIIRDAIYAAGIKMFAAAGKPSTWTEDDIREASRNYFGACEARQGNHYVRYCDDIIRRYKEYSGQLGGS